MDEHLCQTVSSGQKYTTRMLQGLAGRPGLRYLLCGHDECLHFTGTGLRCQTVRRQPVS
jgi:hypothetical protein